MKSRFSLPFLAVALLAILLVATPVLALQGSGRSLPGGPQPPAPMERIAGTVVDLDATAGTITLQSGDGDEEVVQTTDDTRFCRQLPGGGVEPITFDDLALRDLVQALGAWDGDQFLARHVIVMLPPPPPPGQVTGIVIDLDPGAGTITVQPKDRDAVVVQTTGDTHFSRQLPGGELEPITFGDLALDDRVQARGAWDGDVFVARHVIVLLPPPPPVDRVCGTIIELDPEALTVTVQPQDGDPILIQTTDETRFICQLPGGLAHPLTFDDLKLRDPIRALGAWDGDVFDAAQVIVLGGVRFRYRHAEPGSQPAGPRSSGGH